jgi:XTP/dITP diphosphohydrolase
LKVVLATQNKGKIKEFDAMFNDTDINISTFDSSVEEDCCTFEGNALKKALAAMKQSGCIAMADDSGLEVDALNGEPGVLSARFAGKNANDEQNNALLLQKMENKQHRTARFVCVIAIAFLNMDVLISRGECEGVITAEKIGQGGFGYDSVFYIPQEKKTFAELSMKEKNKISHRAKAMKRMKEQINNYMGVSDGK